MGGSVAGILRELCKGWREAVEGEGALWKDRALCKDGGGVGKDRVL